VEISEEARKELITILEPIAKIWINSDFFADVWAERGLEMLRAEMAADPEAYADGDTADTCLTNGTIRKARKYLEMLKEERR
jgi:hypothetical protein